MNAIICLCHFCELHGPSVVFCTQTFRDLPDLPGLDGVEAHMLAQHDGDKHAGEGGSWRYGVVQHGTAGGPTEACVACRSFTHNRAGFISNDDDARVTYVSSQFPLVPELYVLVRHACIRSLSCEVCPGREGPIYFGDEARGHVLSYTFFVDDVQARGFKRSYSILVLMKDKMLLLNSWPFIVRHLEQTIDKLQKKAKKIFEEEESKVSHRALRSAASMNSDNFKRQRAAGQPRSLAELAGDEGVWQRVHSSFTWVLKAGGLRLQERLVEGPPVAAYVAQDSPCDIGVRDFYNAVGPSSFHEIYHNLLVGHQVIFRGKARNVISTVVRSLKPLLPKHSFRPVEFSGVYVESSVCNVLGLDCSAAIPASVTSSEAVCVIEVLSKDTHNDKLIAKDTHNDNIIAKDTHNDNIIAKDTHSGQQETKDTHDVQQVTVTQYDDTDSGRNDSRSVVGASVREGEGVARIRPDTDVHPEEILKPFSFVVLKEGILPPRPPQVLGRVEGAIANTTLTPGTLAIFLTTAIYEWVNKVKVWRHVLGQNEVLRAEVSRLQTHTRVPSPRSLSPLASPQPHAPRSLSPQPFVPRSLSPLPAPQPEPHDAMLNHLLAAVGASEWDVPLLEFWLQNFPS